MGNPARIVVYANTNLAIVEPLVQQGFLIVGVIEDHDVLQQKTSFGRKCQAIYWKFFKRKPIPQLSHFCRNHKIHYTNFDKQSPDKLQDWLTDRKPDLLVLHQAPILPVEIFDLPTFGSINIHPTLLPDYRGSNPFFWLYYNSEPLTGVTIHQVNSGIDTGDIICQQKQLIPQGINAMTLEKAMIKNLAIPMLLDILKSLPTSLTSVPQPRVAGKPYARRLSDKEYMSLLTKDSIDLQHFWHILHANLQWQGVFLKSLPKWQSYQWKLKDFEKCQQAPPYYLAENTKEGFVIKHPQGVIHLTRKKALSTIMKSLLSR